MTFKIDTTYGKEGKWEIVSGGLTIGNIYRDLSYGLGSVGRYRLEIAGTKPLNFSTLDEAKTEVKKFFGTKTRSKRTY